MWRRWRFQSDSDDPRPVRFPPPGPYWISGEMANGNYILIAYLPEDVSLRDYWPEAESEEFTEEEMITWTSRFPQPSWWHAQRSGDTE